MNMSVRIIAALTVAIAIYGCTHIAPRVRTSGPDVLDDGVRFRIYSPNATRVQLGGSWPENNWADGDGSVGEDRVGLMSDADNDGIWELTVPLGPGRYQYLFRIDENTWRLDPGNSEEVDAGPAGHASQIVVILRDGKRELR